MTKSKSQIKRATKRFQRNPKKNHQKVSSNKLRKEIDKEKSTKKLRDKWAERKVRENKMKRKQKVENEILRSENDWICLCDCNKTSIV